MVIGVEVVFLDHTTSTTLSFDRNQGYSCTVLYPLSSLGLIGVELVFLDRTISSLPWILIGVELVFLDHTISLSLNCDRYRKFVNCIILLYLVFVNTAPSTNLVMRCCNLKFLCL